MKRLFLALLFPLATWAQTPYAPTCLQPMQQANIVAASQTLAPLINVDPTDILMRFADQFCAATNLSVGALSDISVAKASIQSAQTTLANLQTLEATDVANLKTAIVNDHTTEESDLATTRLAITNLQLQESKDIIAIKQQLAATPNSPQAPSGVYISPSQVTFAPQAVGTGTPLAQMQYINITNATANPLTINGSGFNGEFGLGGQGNCPTVIPAGAVCAFSVQFLPKGTGLRTGSMTINLSTPINLYHINLAGTGQ